MKVYKIKVNGKAYRVEVEAVEESASKPVADTKKEEPKKAVSVGGDVKSVNSPIQGQVTKIKVNVGDKVKKGDTLLIVEAMKLENEVPSPFDGEVAEILVSKGQNVAAKEVLVTIK